MSSEKRLQSFENVRRQVIMRQFDRIDKAFNPIVERNKDTFVNLEREPALEDDPTYTIRWGDQGDIQREIITRLEMRRGKVLETVVSVSAWIEDITMQMRYSHEMPVTRLRIPYENAIQQAMGEAFYRVNTLKRDDLTESTSLTPHE